MSYANMRRRHKNIGQRTISHMPYVAEMWKVTFFHLVRFEIFQTKIDVLIRIDWIILANQSQRTHPMIYASLDKCYQMKINWDMYELMMCTTSRQSTAFRAHRHKSSFDQLSNVDQVKSGNYDVRKTSTLVAA